MERSKMFVRNGTSQLTEGRVAPGSCLPGAPTDPDVRALAHPVPQSPDSLSTLVLWLSKRVSLTCVSNLDVFGMLPSISSDVRRFASLQWLLQGEFPSFNSTIKSLRLPAAHPAVLRFLRLAVPQLVLVLFAPRRTSTTAKAWSW